MIPQQASDRSHWYGIHVKPKQEGRADANLRRWGLETLSPWLREPRIACGSHATQYRITPLFPGYIFARFDAEALLAKVRLTRGVHSVLGFGEYATPLDDAIISLLRSRMGADGSVRVAEPQPGDAVQIIDGPLRSLVGVFERELRGQDRVLILLTTIGCQVHVKIDKAFIRKTTIRVTA